MLENLIDNSCEKPQAISCRANVKNVSEHFALFVETGLVTSASLVDSGLCTFAVQL